MRDATEKKEEIRCGKCGRLLGKGEVVDFETKCPRCKTLIRIINHGKDR